MYTDEQISRWAASYENQLCAQHNLLAIRISLDIKVGVSEYEIPNYFTNIRGVIFKGQALYPKSFTENRFTADTPGVTSTSKPLEYVFSGKGLRVLKLYPTPGEEVPIYMNDLWTVEADRSACIVEGYRTAELPFGGTWGHLEPYTWGQLEQYTWGQLTSSGARRLPTWFRRYLLKDYVCFKAFIQEGPSQDMRAATFYKDFKMSLNEQYISKIKENMTKSTLKYLTTSPLASRQRPGRPILPPNFPAQRRYV